MTSRRTLGLVSAGIGGSVALLVARTAAAAAAPVTLTDSGSTVTVDNGVASFTVTKADATIHQLTLGRSPNLVGKGAYFAVVNSGGHDGWDVHNGNFHVVRQTPDLVELSCDAMVGHMGFDQHYVLLRGERGFHVFVVMHHRAADPPEGNGQVRWSMYMSNAFNYQLATDREQGLIPDLRGSTPVQDATYRLRDGSVYTKYNYVSYIEEDDVHGLCGDPAHGGGRFGAFVVNGSKEFLQAPTKQEITVHAGPILHRFLVSGHFEPRGLTNQPISGDWSKLCGPWMVYLNTGPSPAAMWADAKAQFQVQAAQWPYAWMDNTDYPIHRAAVTGTLRLYGEQLPAKDALIVLAAPTPDWQVQTLGYLFSTRADEEGHFTLPHVRPGTYALSAVVPGVTGQYRLDKVTVPASGVVDLGTLRFTPPYYSRKLWQIGDASGKATGFALSDLPRQYGYVDRIPASLTYTVGRSKPSTDWYVAQAKPGRWDVVFPLAATPGGTAVLTLGIAGQTNDPRLQVLANGKPVGDYHGGNSSAAYRSAVLGSSVQETKVIRFPASLLRGGSNTITLDLSKGVIHYDCVKLEIDDPSVPKQVPVPGAMPAVE